MKKQLIFLIMLFVLWIPVKTYAADYVVGDINYYVQQYESEDNIIENITVSDITEYVLNIVHEKLNQPLKTASKLIAVIFLYGIVRVFYNSASDGNIVYETVCTIIVFLNLFVPIKEIIGHISENLYSIKNFMVSFMPVYAGISMASGEVFSSTICTGFMLSAMVFISDMCLNYIIPSFSLYFAVIISNALSPYIKLESISDFYSKIVRGTMKTAVSVLCFVLTIQSTITQSKDNIALKAGKALTGNLIPVIGSTLQDAVSSVYASMEAIKNFTGFTGVITVISICLPTVIMLFIYWRITNLLLITCDILEAQKIKKCIKGFVEIIQLMISVVILYIVMLVFFLTIFIMVTGGG